MVCFPLVSKLCLTLWSYGLQQVRLPCPSLFHGVCSNSCPLSLWCYLTISSSTIPFFFAFNLFQHQNLFQWVSFSHQVAQVLELQHQSLQWIFRIGFLQVWLVGSTCSTRDSQDPLMNVKISGWMFEEKKDLHSIKVFSSRYLSTIQYIKEKCSKFIMKNLKDTKYINLTKWSR